MEVEKIEIETFFGKCKCCLKYGYLKTMWEPHVVNEEKEIYGQMLTQCFSITWTIQGSEEDDQICEDCIWKVREAFMFKKQVQNCQRVLENGTDGAELKVDLDESYAAEYLDEEILDHTIEGSDDDINESLDGGSDDERESVDDDDDDDDDDKRFNVVFSDNDDEFDVNQNPEDEGTDDDGSSGTRKRKSAQIDTESDPDAPKPKWPKRLPKEERWKTYKQYTEETLRKAVHSVTSKQMNQKQASKLYKVPRKTLSAEIRALRDVPNAPKFEDAEMPDFGVLRKHRENIRSVLAYSNATPIRGYFGGGYVCAFCPKQFLHAPDLKTHVKSHGNISRQYTVASTRKHCIRLDITDLQCKICATLFEDLQSLMYHLKDQHGKAVHFDIDNHMMPFKFDTKELQCAICKNEFTHFKGLSEHMSHIHIRNYICVKCDRGFVNRSNLSAHRNSHRLGLFDCDYCGKAFDTRRKKTSHERTHRLSSEPTSDHRQRKMTQKTSPKRTHRPNSEPTSDHRQRKMTQKTFSCNVCDKNFARRVSLRAHIHKEHTSFRPYKCPEKGCNKAFYLNRTLQSHILTHDDAKPYLCEVCQRSYRDARRLKDHMTLAHSVREFKCEKCTKSYVNEDNLKRHVKDKH